jgi:hypothetical protein
MATESGDGVPSEGEQEAEWERLMMEKQISSRFYGALTRDSTFG